MNDLVGKKVRLKIPIRAGEGKSYFKEIATIIRVTENLGRIMWLIRFSDDVTTFIFPDENEVEIIDE